MILHVFIAHKRTKYDGIFRKMQNVLQQIDVVTFNENNSNETNTYYAHCSFVSEKFLLNKLFRICEFVIIVDCS